MLRPGAKPWKSLTDDSILQAVAAWNWVHEFFRVHRQTAGIGSYKMSKLMHTLMVVRRISANAVYASMGNHVFAAMGLRLHQFVVDGTAAFKFDATHKECELLYVTDPSDWEAVPFIAARLPGHGVVMQQCADALPLMRHALRQEEHTLTEVDIEECTKILELERKDTVAGNFLAIAKHFCGTDDGDSPAVLAEVGLYERAYNSVPDSGEELLADPLLEAVYEDLDDEDKGEFREIGEAKQRRKYRARVRTWQVAHGEAQDEFQRKRRRLMRPKAKGKAKAKAAAAPGPPAPAPEPVEHVLEVPEPALPAVLQPPLPAPALANVLEGPAPALPAVLPPPAPEPGVPEPPGAPPPLPPPMGPDVAAHIRAANYGNTTGWDDILCDRCHCLAGQKKYNAAPGMRDGETWYMRCFNYVGNSWPVKLPGYRAKRHSTMQDAEGFIHSWVQSNRSCCQDE